MIEVERKRRGAIITLLVLFCCLTIIVSQGYLTEAAGGGNTYLPIIQDANSDTVYLTPIATGWGAQTTVSIVDAGDDRLFVATQQGYIHVLKPNPGGGAMLVSTFLDWSGNVSSSFEEGLLGVAFHPNYASNGYFYVTYTGASDGNIILARFSVSGNPDVADPTSQMIMITIPKPPEDLSDPPTGYSQVHNAGDLHFGADGYLYIAVGDGGPDPYDVAIVPGDVFNNAQRLSTLLGKFMRIDVNNGSGYAPDCGAKGYTIPWDNPFANGAGLSCDEVWSRGWRNPWRFDIDPLTGDLFIGDVGEWEREEVNKEPAGTGGLNYGWQCYEGFFDHSEDPDTIATCTDPSNYAFPFFEFERMTGSSIIGGKVYRGSQSGYFFGQYVFADFGSGRMWHVPADLSDGVALLNVEIVGGATPQWTSFGRGADGELYVGAFLFGQIYRLDWTP